MAKNSASSRFSPTLAMGLNTGEAGQEREVRRPELQQTFAERAFMRQTNLQHEQRHGDGEDAVAECFHSRCLFGFFHGAGGAIEHPRCGGRRGAPREPG